MAMQAVFADTIRIYPDDDAYVNSLRESDNYDTGELYAGLDSLSGISVQRGIVRSYLKFDLSPLEGYTVTDAALSLSVGAVTGSPTIEALYVSSDSWSQSSLNWNNAPGFSTLLDSQLITSNGRVDFDIGSVLGESTLSLALKGQDESISKNFVKFTSNEDQYGSLRPYIEAEVLEDVPSIVINEFVHYADFDENNWVEFYNPSGDDFNSDECILKGTFGRTIADPEGIIPAGQWVTYDADWLKIESYSMQLECYGEIVDQVVYGDDPSYDDDGNIDNNALASGIAESVGRISDGYDTDNDRNDFTVFEEPTKGTSNGEATSCSILGDEVPCCQANLLEFSAIVNNYFNGLTSLSLLEFSGVVNNYFNGQNIC